MTQRMDPVRPGDLITAESWNGLVITLQGLAVRVSALEAGHSGDGNVAITNLVPSTPVRSGQEMEILGRNFGFTQGAQRAYFNDSPVTVFRTGSSDSRLIIVVPNVPGVTEAGTPVTLTVTSANSSDTRQVTVRPAQVNQQGNVTLTYLRVDPATIVAGSPATFRFRLDSAALLPAVVTITPTISQTPWQDLLQVLDSQDNVVSNRQISINPGEAVQLAVRISQVPVGTSTGTVFTLTTAASASGMAGDQDGPRSFTVGTVSELPDPHITELAFNVALPPEAESNNIIRLAPNTNATIRLRAEFDLNQPPAVSPPAHYNLSVVAPPTASGWTARLSQNGFFATPDHYDITISPSIELPAFDILAGATPSASAQVVFTIQRAGETSNRTITFALQRL